MGYPTEEGSRFGYCLECGDIIEYGSGRPDRKFCSCGCKNRWHNRRKARSWERYRLKIQRVLEVNHAILDRLLSVGVTSIDLISLDRLGYDPNYVTSFHKVGHRNLYSCYDITYEATPSRIMHLASNRNGQDQYAEEEEGAAPKKQAKRPSAAVSGDP